MDKTIPTLADVREGVLRATERIKSWPKWKRDLYPGDPHDDLEQCVHTAVKSHCKDCRIAELEAKLETERLKSREWGRLYASACTRANIALRELEIGDSKSCEGCKHWYEEEACDYEIGGGRAPEMYTVRRCEIGVRHPGGNLEPSSPDFACNRFKPKQ